MWKYVPEQGSISDRLDHLSSMNDKMLHDFDTQSHSSPLNKSARATGRAARKKQSQRALAQRGSDFAHEV